MSMMHPLPSAERSRRYYQVRTVVRVVFWSVFFIGGDILINAITGVKY